MAVIAKLFAYDVVRCGYYARGQRQPEFGTMPEILGELADWVRDRRLGSTKLSNGGGEETVVGTYCLGLREVPGHDDFVLAIWNETPAHQGKFASVRRDSRVGSARVTMTDVPDGGIPGFPTYFYLMPTENVCFAVRFEGQRLTGHKAMSSYLDSFVKFATSYVVREDGEGDEIPGEVGVIGYSDEDHDEIDVDSLRHLYAHFSSRPRRDPGKIEWLRRRVGNIRKLIQKDELHSQTQADRNLFDRLMRRVGIEEPVMPPLSISMKVDLDVDLDEADFDSIVATSEGGGEDFDLGFKVSGSNDVHWLSHSFTKTDVSLDVNLGEGWMVDLDELGQAFVRNRRHIRGLLIG